MRLAILLLTAVVAATVTQGQAARHEDSAERESVISQAIADAKAHKRRQSLADIQRTRGSKYISTFSKVSKEDIKQGEARLMYEDMVYMAERRLVEMNRKSAGTYDAQARAEELAFELFHKPGSQLTEEELARMWQESGCKDITVSPPCNDPVVMVYRTIDGTCNNLDNPLFGASNTPFARFLSPQYENGINSLRGGLQARGSDLLRIGKFVPPYPSVRLISQQIFRNMSKREQPFTHLFMEYGHFLDHDMTRSPRFDSDDCNDCIFTDMCEPIFVPEDDPAFGEGTRLDGDCLRFGRSIPACEVSAPGQFRAREQLNALTAYIDGSNVYGSTDEVSGWIRAFKDGLLLEGEKFPGEKSSLPVDTHDYMSCGDQTNCYLAGDNRANENTGLLSVHTIWFREHNRIARKLGEINPSWDDEKIFHEARKIVGAVLQKITYEDYLPKLFGSTVSNEVIRPYNGYDKSVDPGIPSAFATAAFRYGHSLSRAWYSRLDSSYKPLDIGSLNLEEAFFNPPVYKTSNGTDPILRGLVVDKSNHVDEFLNYVLTSHLFETDVSTGQDLASRNLQRARDHGNPPYLTYQRFCNGVFPNLYPLTGIPEFTNELTHVHLLQLYGSLDTVDLWIAGLAEERLPGSLVGPTFACLIGITFSNVRDGDRFYYENSGVFPPNQLAEIKKGTLSRVVCDNSDGIDQIQPDAFLENQSRVSCASLPSIDLNQWHESKKSSDCYARVEVVAHTEPLLVRVFSRSNQPQFTSSSNQFTHSQASQFQCMPVACATAAADTEVLVTTKTKTVSVTPNAELSPNKLQWKNHYRGTWPREKFAQQSGGVFLTEAACIESSHVGLTFSKGSDQQSLNEVQRLELALKEEDGSEYSEDKKLQADLESFFGIDTKGGSLGIGTATAEEVATDQELISELEEAMQDLTQ